MSDIAPLGAPNPIQYDQQRRLQATGRIALTIGIILAAFISALTVFIAHSHVSPSQATVAFALDSLLVGYVGLFGLGAYTAQRRIEGVAEGLTILAINAGIITFDILWVYPLGNGLDAVILVAFAVAGVVVGITGALGRTWMVWLATVVMNALTLFLALFAPVNSDFASLWGHERALIIPLAVLEQWALAAIIVTFSSVYRQTVADVTRAYEQARRLDQVKDQFITHVNHELRTPIMALHGYVEYSLTLWNTISDAELEEVLQRASRTGYRLVDLLNSILDVRRIDADASFPRTVVALPDVLDAALQLIDPRDAAPHERVITMQVAPDLAVWGEPIRLQQVLTNLLSNAIKYSPATAPIEVTAQVVQDTTTQDGGRWRQRTITTTTTTEMVEIAIRDHGLGVPLDQQDLLFHRFTRLPRDLASQVRGNGLGLYLCRTLITAMGGRIWLESSGVPGEGTTFRIRLPRAVAPIPVSASAG